MATTLVRLAGTAVKAESGGTSRPRGDRKSTPSSIRNNSDCFEGIRLDPMNTPRLAAGRLHLCVADTVLEHLEEPNGFLCIRTPNAWGYVGIAARILANRIHGSVLAKVRKRCQLRCGKMLGVWSLWCLACGLKGTGSHCD
jgi:hypothetical protein